VQSNSNNLPTYFAFLFPVLFIAFWTFICFLISLMSGWSALTRRFRAQSEPYGDTRSAGPFFCGVQMRFRCNYNNAVRLTVTGEALFLSVVIFFRVGHPPLAIPWQEIQLRRKKFLWLRFVVLTLGNEEKIPLRISERIARKLGILDRIPNQLMGATSL
jgi:hypothetical protein